MPDIYRVPPVGAPDPASLSDEILRPLLGIRHLAAGDRVHIERLIEDAERAAAGLGPDAPQAHIDLYLERTEKILAQAREIVALYS